MERVENTLQEAKESLIHLIEWYRDDYHKGLFSWDCHNELIKQVNQVTDFNQLEIYEKIVDGWLD